MASSSRLDLFDQVIHLFEQGKEVEALQVIDLIEQGKEVEALQVIDLIEDLPPKRIKTASTSSPSSPSSSASPPNLKWTYDVVLSFRGEDTGNNFADYLYMNLTQKGIYTFRDDEKLERGKEISGDLLKEIEGSRLAIIIFSENYASSSWCLDELVKIIDCTKKTGQIAYPVFYNVDPSDVRKQKGSFAKAFDKHLEKNVTLGKMKKWKKALSHAGRLSGWDTRGSHEAKIIQEIVEVIFDKLSRGLPLDDNLIGMEIHMEKIKTRLDIGSNDVKFVGIHGLGGIGKTTIAKFIYNRISYQFDGCSYLANIRERYEREGSLVSLQKQLLYNTLKAQDLQIFDDDSGSFVIQHRLKHQKVLVILDDVDHVNQLEKLAGNGKWFGPGSRIIITTRDQHLLNIYEGVQRYEVKECDLDKSLEIFSWKAFKRNYPLEDYMELSNEVVHYAKGIPLTLTVLGSHLCGRSKDAWKGAIEKLKIIPNKEITEILEISNDEGLEELQKLSRALLPSSAYPPNLKWTYDVFLSFRGEDTLNSFVDHLFMKLTQKGIKTFRHDEKLERGKEISGHLVKAIEESKFAIIIFSENYASSSWCLDELVQIIDCTKETGQIAYPVFYNVDSSNVRKQEGSFAKAFDEHEKKNVALGKMNKWREALSQAGSLSGWDCWDRPEAKIIQEIGEKILYMLSRALLHVDDNFVGMEIHMKEINTLLDTRSNDVKFVGIYGLGGIGKTTIAKVIYNRIYNQFEACSYLANVRERYEMERNLASLQKQLLCEILKVQDLQIFDDDNGSSIIRNRLKNQKVLVILDDVDNVNQLEKLAGNGKWFGPGSRIIITTRDQHLLNIYEGVQRYEVKECDRDKSLEIFSWKAFKRNYPPEDYMELSNEVVRYAKGLPLALIVLGSHLRGRSKDEWKGALDQLKIVPNEDVTKILKISYKGLNSIQKDVFLDIACFFNGKDKDEVMQKLDSFGFFPSINMQVLIDKSLITVSDENELMMHDLVRDMGRHIVHQESPKNPGKQSRLWNSEDIRGVLENNMATEAIEGIQPKAFMHDWSFKDEAFMKMKNLRFLEWEYYPCKHLALDFPHDKLVHLSLKSSSLELLWNGRKVLPHLKSINLSPSEYLREFPDVSELPNLERLSLHRCSELVKIDPSVWVHKGLKFLDLSDCYNLESFPNKIEMESLETLDLGRCYKMKEFPEVHGNMKCLSKLVLTQTVIKELPSSIENFTALKSLDLYWCNNLMCLPSSICKLKYLAKLHLRGCTNLEKLPESIGELKSLVVLGASRTAIKEVPASFNFLEKLGKLSFANCSGLKLPSFYGLSSLTELDLSWCDLTDETFPSNIECLSSLKTLYLSGNNFVSLPTNISKLPLLNELHLAGCMRIESIPKLPSVKYKYF